MLWIFMMVSLFRFDGDLGGVGFGGGVSGTLRANDGMTGIPPKANDGMTGIPPNAAYHALDGMTGIPPR
ncbi:MAG TPA: hypothetical protein VN461_03930 [Vicinamibacteria bacterium]|jgi:hypothetical protein|nr:hypothetical protein [Vicinamibacteria bacterium]